VRRDTGQKVSLAVLGLANRLRPMLELIQVDMFAKAEAAMKAGITAIASIDDAREGINKMGWCGRSECGLAVTEKTGMNVLGTPYYEEPASGKCAVCKEPAKAVLYAAKAY
jgi:prolyl-tRNA synthetase